jgi:hypothetical protein
MRYGFLSPSHPQLPNVLLIHKSEIKVAVWQAVMGWMVTAVDMYDTHEKASQTAFTFSMRGWIPGVPVHTLLAASGVHVSQQLGPIQNCSTT